MEKSSYGPAMLFAVAGVVFGLVVAGSLDLTPRSFAATDDHPPQSVAPASTAVGMPDFADLAEAVLPAVVFVQSTTIENADARGGSPLDFFFRDRGGGGEQPREFRQDGAGSGFLVSSDGWIVTNNHVIEGATSVTVLLDDHEYEAKVQGADPATDIAVLRIERDEPFAYLALGSSEELRVGEWVMAVGNPLSLASSVTVGIVSAKGRVLPGLTGDTSFDNFIQTDAAINRGNSGGPLVNLRGEVIGISTAMNFGAENIGFAVPVDTLKNVLPQLRSEGRVRRGYLGVNIQNIADDDQEAWGLDSTDGALVTDVRQDTPAEKAGLRHGDVILEVDGRPVEDTRGLIDYISAKPPGETVVLGLLRDGKRIDKDVKLEERDTDTQVAEILDQEGESELEWLGVQYDELEEGTRRQLGIPSSVRGVVVTDVAPSSPLFEEGVGPGTVISEVNGVEVADIAEFEDAVASVESGGFLRLYVQQFGRGGRQAFFAIVRKP